MLHVKAEYLLLLFIRLMLRYNLLTLFDIYFEILILQKFKYKFNLRRNMLFQKIEGIFKESYKPFGFACFIVLQLYVLLYFFDVFLVYFYAGVV
jgi:hypothetical protein